MRRQVFEIRRRDEPRLALRAWRRGTQTPAGAAVLSGFLALSIGIAAALVSNLQSSAVDTLDSKLLALGWSGVWQVQIAVAAIALPLLLLALTMIRDEWMFAVQSRFVLLSESRIIFVGQFAVAGAVVIGLHSVLLDPGAALAVDVLAIVCPTLILTALSLYRALGLLLDSERLRRHAADHACRLLRDSQAETTSTNVARHEAASRMEDAGLKYMPFVVDPQPDDVRIRACVPADVAAGRPLALTDIDGSELPALGRLVAGIQGATDRAVPGDKALFVTNIGDSASADRDTLLVLRAGSGMIAEETRSQLTKTARSAFIIGRIGNDGRLAYEAMLDQVIAHLVSLVGDGAVAVFQQELREYQRVFDALLADSAAYRDVFGEAVSRSSHVLPGRHQPEVQRFRQDVHDLADVVVDQHHFTFARAFVSFLDRAAHDALARGDGASAEYLLHGMVDVYRKWLRAGRSGGDLLAGMINLQLSNTAQFGPVGDRLRSDDANILREASGEVRRLLLVWRDYLLAAFEMRNLVHFSAACETLIPLLNGVWLHAEAQERIQHLKGVGGADRGAASVASELRRFLLDRDSILFGVGMMIMRSLIEDPLDLAEAEAYLDRLSLPANLRELTEIFVHAVEWCDADPWAWETLADNLLVPVIVTHFDMREWLTRFWVLRAIATQDLTATGGIEPTETFVNLARGPDSRIGLAYEYLIRELRVSQLASFRERWGALAGKIESAVGEWDERRSQKDR